MNRLLAVQVPLEAIDIFINSVGCLRYTIVTGSFQHSTCVEPETMGVYLEKEIHTIVGDVIINDVRYIIING
jgi:hypothetical protein